MVGSYHPKSLRYSTLPVINGLPLIINFCLLAECILSDYPVSKIVLCSQRSFKQQTKPSKVGQIPAPKTRRSMSGSSSRRASTKYPLIQNELTVLIIHIVPTVHDVAFFLFSSTTVTIQIGYNMAIMITTTTTVKDEWRKNELVCAKFHSLICDRNWRIESLASML